jgi:serine protease Do
MRRAAPVIGLTALVSFLLGVVAAGTRPTLPASALPPVPNGPKPVTVIRSEVGVDPAPVAAAGVDFAQVAARINAAVVNVDAAARGGEDRFRSSRFATDDPGGPREGSGSGFIIDPSGLILTNYHVIENVDRITVTLSDGRAFKASVVGVDPAIDVALLQVPSTSPLPVAPLGDSDTLRVGEWVCAIGNPLGVYVHSVTVGVVSYLGRKLFDQSLDAFIQTDAAISFGNSGGPLLNSRGQVVGITTAISAQASNIGFAIPISQVIGVLAQLREYGRVSRGFIGVGLTNLTPELRRALRLGPEHGALVQDVTPGDPGERAGLRPYDVIVGVDGRTIRSDEELIRYISARLPGAAAALDVSRDGQTRSITVKLAERPLPETRGRAVLRDARPVVGPDLAPLGLSVRDLDASSAARLRIPDTIQGVLITNVDPAGPARLAGLRANHVVLEINRRRVTSVADYRAVVASLRPGEVAALLVYDHSSDQRVIATIVPDPQS